jgi:S-adenosyl methyltransferase
MAGDERDGGSLGFDVTVAHPARVYTFFSGLDMVEPGLAQLPRWRPDLGYIGPAGGITLSAYCGVGRKPRGGS